MQKKMQRRGKNYGSPIIFLHSCYSTPSSALWGIREFERVFSAGGLAGYTLLFSVVLHQHLTIVT
jgi:hypothetical protein